MLTQLEVPVLLNQFLHNAPLRIPRTVGIAVFFGEERFLLHRIKSPVGRLVEVTRRVEPVEQRHHDALVTGIGGANEVIVTQAEGLDEGTPLDGEVIAVGLRRLAQIEGRLLDLLAVFVQSGQEEDRLSQASPSPSDDIGHHLFVGVPQVGSPVHIINRRGDVEPLVHVRAIQTENASKSKSLLAPEWLCAPDLRCLDKGRPSWRGVGRQCARPWRHLSRPTAMTITAPMMIS